MRILLRLRSLSIVIPAFNEEKRLPQTLAKLTRFLDASGSTSSEVLVVDDGSRDATAEVAARAAEADERFRVLRNPGNRGKGYAVRHGMLAATGAWRLITDADLSTPIEELEKLYAAANESGAAVVIGSRALDRTLVTSHQSAFRELGGRFFNLMVRAITGLPFADTQCGFKLYRADAAQAVFARQQLDGFSFDVEDLFIARRRGFGVVETPVAWANAEGTKVTVASTLRAFADLGKIRGFSARGKYD